MRIETEIYRAIARVVARGLGRVDSVTSVYARRSVAAGAVVLGRSDIDLHVIVLPSASLEAEADLLADLARRFKRMKVLFPCLGHFDVSTRGELERWYREQPFHRYRDRGWLHLYGEEFERPSGTLGGPGRNRTLWWYFWAAQQLPRNFRTGNARTCFNLILDMFDAYRHFSGLADTTTMSRAAQIEAWYDSGPSTAARAAIVRASRMGFRGHRGAALVPLYRESLALHDALFPHVSDRVEGKASGTLASRVPPSFAERRYVLVEATNRGAVEEGLEAMRRDDTVWLLTEGALWLYLFHRNPWEYEALSPADGSLELAPPADEAFHQAVRFSLYREIPRHYGLRGDHAQIGPLYAQARLYADEKLVVSDPTELQYAYRRRYGAELVSAGSQREYFRLHYPAVCRVIDELRNTVGPQTLSPAKSKLIR